MHPLHHEPLNEVMDFHETWIYTGTFARINIQLNLGVMGMQSNWKGRSKKHVWHEFVYIKWFI